MSDVRTGGYGPESYLVRLPFPPSANRLWRSPPGSRRPILSEEYRAWKQEAAQVLKYDGFPFQLTGRVVVHLYFTFPTQAGDLGNRIKAVEDALQDAGVIENDRDIYGLFAMRAPEPAKPGGVTVQVLPWKPPPAPD